MNGRRLLVIACNDEARTLNFIPELPQAFYDAMVDANSGGCRHHALPLINPSRDKLIDALADVIQAAGRERDELILYFLGHGTVNIHSNKYYFGASNSVGVDLASEFDRLLSGAPPPRALALILDTCHSGGGAVQAAAVCGGLTQFSILAAVTSGLAYNGDFSRALLDLMRDESFESTTGTISLEEAANWCGRRLQKTELPFYISGKQGGRAIPYLARNPAYDGAGGRSLPQHFQPPKALSLIEAGLRNANVVHVTGSFGAGKTTLAIALVHLFGPRGKTSPNFLHAAVFLTPHTTTGILAETLCAQLALSSSAFRESLHTVDDAPIQRLRAGNPLIHRVLQPLEAMRTNASVRIVIDGCEEISGPDAPTIRTFLRQLSRMPLVRLALFAHRDSDLPGSGARKVDVNRADEHDLTAYPVARGIADPALRAAILNNSRLNWQQTCLLAALAESGEPATSLGKRGQSHYFRRLLENLDHIETPWSTHLAPVLGIVALAGKGPILPIELLLAASERLNGPATLPAVREVLARLNELTEQSDAGKPTELLGLAFPALESYLFSEASGDHLLDRQTYETALVEAIETLAPRVAMWSGRVEEYAWRREADHLESLRHPALLDSLHFRRTKYLTEDLQRLQSWRTIFSKDGRDRTLNTLYISFQIELISLEILRRQSTSGSTIENELETRNENLQRAYNLLNDTFPDERATISANRDWADCLAARVSVQESLVFSEKLAQRARLRLSIEDFILLEIECTLLTRKKEAAEKNELILQEIEPLLSRIKKTTGTNSRIYLDLLTFRASILGQSDPVQAVSQLQDILNEKRSHTSDDDESVLTTRHNLVVNRLRLDIPEQTHVAFTEVEKLVEDQIRYFGRFHYDSIQTRLLDCTVGFTKEFRSASASHRKLSDLLHDATQALKPEHEILIVIRGWRAVVAHAIGSTDASISECATALDALLASNLRQDRLSKYLRLAAGREVITAGVGM